MINGLTTEIPEKPLPSSTALADRLWPVDVRFVVRGRCGAQRIFHTIHYSTDRGNYRMNYDA
jgi:hypothetical protein